MIMWEAPVVEEIRKVREAHAAKYNYDLYAIYRALKKEETESGHQFVSLPPRQLESAGEV